MIQSVMKIEVVDDVEEQNELINFCEEITDLYRKAVQSSPITSRSAYSPSKKFRSMAAIEDDSVVIASSNHPTSASVKSSIDSEFFVKYLEKEMLNEEKIKQQIRQDLVQKQNEIDLALSNCMEELSRIKQKQQQEEEARKKAAELMFEAKKREAKAIEEKKKRKELELELEAQKQKQKELEDKKNREQEAEKLREMELQDQKDQRKTATGDQIPEPVQNLINKFQQYKKSSEFPSLKSSMINFRIQIKTRIGSISPSTLNNVISLFQNNYVNNPFLQYWTCKCLVQQARVEVSVNHSKGDYLAKFITSLPSIDFDILVYFLVRKCWFIIHKFDNCDALSEDKVDESIGVFAFYCWFMMYYDKGKPLVISRSPWSWLSRMLNINPKNLSSPIKSNGIVASLIFTLLEICGKYLLQTYGRQGYKLISFIQTDYLTLLAHSPSKVRLELFVEKLITK